MDSRYEINMGQIIFHRPLPIDTRGRHLLRAKWGQHRFQGSITAAHLSEKLVFINVFRHFVVSYYLTRCTSYLTERLTLRETARTRRDLAGSGEPVRNNLTMFPIMPVGITSNIGPDRPTIEPGQRTIQLFLAQVLHVLQHLLIAQAKTRQHLVKRAIFVL